MLLTGYAVGVGWTAWSDLTARYTVQGLHRGFESPYEVTHGHVIDPRPGSLRAELIRRFGGAGALRRSFDAKGLGDGQHPRLVRVEDAVWLVIGVFDRRHVVFDPAVGVVLLHPGAIGDVPAAELTDLREAPW